jgi:nicotinamidase-related amidase
MRIWGLIRGKNRNRALIIIDVQNEYFTGKLPVKYPEGNFENILRVMDAAKQKEVPIVMIQHTNPSDASTFAKGSERWKLQRQIASRGYDKLFEKAFPEVSQEPIWSHG